MQRQFGEATRRLQGDYWRRAIEAHTPKGQEPDLERGVVIPVASHERLISMRAHESRRLIKRVIASAFRQEK